MASRATTGRGVGGGGVPNAGAHTSLSATPNASLGATHGVPAASASDWWCALDNNHVSSQETRSGLAVCSQMPQVAALLHGAVLSEDSCRGPPPPPPRCCYYDAETCSAGETCCSSKGASYANSAMCAKYGAKHACVWESDINTCVVGKGTNA